MDNNSKPSLPSDRRGPGTNTRLQEFGDITTVTASPLPNSEKPQKWPRGWKWVYIAIVGYCECLTSVSPLLPSPRLLSGRRWKESYLQLISSHFKTNFPSRFLVSMMLAPSVPQVLAEFRPLGGSKSLGSFSVTVYILGFCVGPLLLGPLTDLYGRIVIYRLSIVGFILFTVSCALSPSLEALITFRFFAGCFGGAPMAIGGAVIADMYEPGKRDWLMVSYSPGTMMGPTIGPVLGGVITGHYGWRWLFWVAAILVSYVPTPAMTRSDSGFPLVRTLP